MNQNYRQTEKEQRKLNSKTAYTCRNRWKGGHRFDVSEWDIFFIHLNVHMILNEVQCSVLERFTWTLHTHTRAPARTYFGWLGSKWHSMAQRTEHAMHIQICDTNHVHFYTHKQNSEHINPLVQPSVCVCVCGSVEFIKAEGQNRNSSESTANA